MTRRTGFPRPPVDIPKNHRQELLRSLPDLLMEATYFGHSAATSDVFGLFASVKPEQYPEVLNALKEGQLHPQVVRLCLTRAQILALRDPDQAQDLVQLARVLALEFEDAVPTCDPLDDLMTTAENFALRAEVESTSALVSALLGAPDEARRRLQVAASILDTPTDLTAAGRTRSGRLAQLRSVARFALRGHGRWLTAAAILEATLGNLDHAVGHARDAVELYLQARDYFLAGFAAYQAARIWTWRGRPALAAEELELALQLMDLRTSPRLHGRLLVELAFLHFETGAAVLGNEEIEIARQRQQVQESDFFAARGWLFALTGERREGVRWLRKARDCAVGGAVRSWPLLTLDLVETELELPFPREDPVRWLEDSVTKDWLRRQSEELQESWRVLREGLRSGEVSVEMVRELRAGVRRMEAFPEPQ